MGLPRCGPFHGHTEDDGRPGRILARQNVACRESAGTRRARRAQHRRSHIRLYVGRHPTDVAGVVLFDPTVPSFARTYDKQESRPGWDGTSSARQVEQVTAWPDIPFAILRHDPAVYADQNIWSADVEADWGAAQDAYAALATHGTVTVVPGSGHNIHQDAPGASVATVRRVLAELR